MGNCCDFIESDVRDKHNQPQQGMVWVKNNKKQHNIFKDRNEVPFRIIRNDSNMSLTRALKYDTQHRATYIMNSSYESMQHRLLRDSITEKFKKEKSAANIFEQYQNQNGDNLTFAPNSESRRREFDRSIEEDGLAINVSFNGQMQDVKSYDREMRSDQGGGAADHVGIFIEHSTSNANFNEESKNAQINQDQQSLNTLNQDILTKQISIQSDQLGAATQEKLIANQSPAMGSLQNFQIGQATQQISGAGFTDQQKRDRTMSIQSSSSKSHYTNDPHDLRQTTSNQKFQFHQQQDQKWANNIDTFEDYLDKELNDTPNKHDHKNCKIQQKLQQINSQKQNNEPHFDATMQNGMNS